MLRGSRPGERRGGRTRGTPNRRSILRDRILAIGLDDPTASQHAFLLKLGRDPKLPADIRIAIAPRCFPAKRTSRAGRPQALGNGRTRITRETLGIEGSAVALNGTQKPTAVPAMRDWTPQALDALFGVVQDAGADAKARSDAALKLAEYLLPKIGAKPKIMPDEYGFVINPALTSAYRKIERELGHLVNEPTRKIPAIAARIKKLEARAAAIEQRFQAPCPSKYGVDEAARDLDRLTELAKLRRTNARLTEPQKAEEAHLWARRDVLNASPESIARRRCAALADADRRFRRYRSTGGLPAPPLSRRERSTLKLLRWLYPAGPKPDLAQLETDEFEMYRGHPFADQLPASDGNFYPPHSKLRPGPPNKDAVKAHLAPGEARLRELAEDRAGGIQLTAPEQGELRDLRECHPEYAAVMDLMDLEYLYHWKREFEIARKAGVDIDAIREHAEACCLRFRDECKFLHEWQARRYLLERRGETARAATRAIERTLPAFG